MTVFLIHCFRHSGKISIFPYGSLFFTVPFWFYGMCVSVRLLVLFQFSTCLCDAGFSSRNIYVDEQTNTNAICWIERIYSHHPLYIYVIFLLLFRVRRTFRPAWILECMSADWFSTIQWYVAPNFTQALLQYMVPLYRIRTHWPSHQLLSVAFFLHSFNSSCHLQFHRNVWSRPIQFNCRLKMSNYLNFEKRFIAWIPFWRIHHTGFDFEPYWISMSLEIYRFDFIHECI